MLKFRKIKGQGFGSLIEPFSFVFGTIGLKIIKGENGTGKTTSISLMAWTLYGTSLKGKDPQTWKHLRPKKWYGTYGRVDFENDNGKIKVIRCKKWKKEVWGSKGGDGLFLSINGKLQRHEDKKATQKAINKELGMSFELFKNSIMFGQKMKRIINESGPIQSKVFEEAFEADFINVAKTNAEKERLDLNELISQVDSDLIIEKLKYKTVKGFIKSQKELSKQFDKNKRNRISLIQKELDSTEDEIKSLEKKCKNYNPELDRAKGTLGLMNTHIDNNNKIQTKLDESVLGREKLILKIGQISRVCDKCGSKVSRDKIKKQEEYLLAQKVKVENKIKQIKKKVKLAVYTLDDIDKQEDLIGVLHTKIYRSKLNSDSLGKLDAKQLQRRKDIISIEKETLDNNSLKKAQKERKAHKIRISKLEDELKVYEEKYDILQWCIKEPLSNKGLKAYIFDSQLLAVNERLEALSELLPFRIEFGIDTDTKSKKFYTLVEHSGGIVPYEDLSGGEQQLVNIAIAFSIHDVVSEDVNSLFMDEVFESLDKTNIEIVGDLVLQKADTKEVLLVTHTSFYPTGAEIIHYSKNAKGVTEIT